MTRPASVFNPLADPGGAAAAGADDGKPWRQPAAAHFRAYRSARQAVDYRGGWLALGLVVAAHLVLILAVRFHHEAVARVVPPGIQMRLVDTVALKLPAEPPSRKPVRPPQPAFPIKPALANREPAETRLDLPTTAAPLLVAAPGPVQESSPLAATQAPATPAPELPAPPRPVVREAALQPPRFDADYLSNPRPAYPPLSRRLGEAGKVLLRVRVAVNGTPVQVELHQGSGFARLDQAAMDAVARWRFIPARRGDEAAESWVTVPITFTLGT